MKVAMTYSEVLPESSLEPFLHASQVHPRLDEAQLASTLDQLVRLYYQLLQTDKRTGLSFLFG